MLSVSPRTTLISPQSRSQASSRICYSHPVCLCWLPCCQAHAASFPPQRANVAVFLAPVHTKLAVTFISGRALLSHRVWLELVKGLNRLLKGGLRGSQTMSSQSSEETTLALLHHLSGAPSRPLSSFGWRNILLFHSYCNSFPKSHRSCLCLCNRGSFAPERTSECGAFSEIGNGVLQRRSWI